MECHWSSCSVDTIVCCGAGELRVAQHHICNGVQVNFKQCSVNYVLKCQWTSYNVASNPQWNATWTSRSVASLCLKGQWTFSSVGITICAQEQLNIIPRYPTPPHLTPKLRKEEIGWWTVGRLHEHASDGLNELEKPLFTTDHKFTYILHTRIW